MNHVNDNQIWFEFSCDVFKYMIILVEVCTGMAETVYLYF